MCLCHPWANIPDHSTHTRGGSFEGIFRVYLIASWREFGFGGSRVVRWSYASEGVLRATERRRDLIFGGSFDGVIFLRNFGLGGSIRERISYPLSLVFQSPSSSIKNRYRHPEYYYYGRQAVYLVWSWTEGLSVHLSVHRWWSLMLCSLLYSSVFWFLNIIQPH